MTAGLWLRVRRVPLVLAVVAGIVVVHALVSGYVFVAPSVVGRGGLAAWSMFLVVGVGAAVVVAMTSLLDPHERRASPRARALDVLLLGALVVLAGTGLLVAGGSHPSVAGTYGQVMVAVGVGVVALLRRGVAAGSLAPVALAVGCLSYGADAPGAEFVRVFAPDASGLAVLGWGVLALGLAVVLVWRREVGAAER